MAQDAVPKIMVIFPANNEDDITEHVISIAKKVTTIQWVY